MINFVEMLIILIIFYLAHISLKRVRIMKDNGKMEKDVGKESKFGMMVQFMKDSGINPRLMDMED